MVYSQSFPYIVMLRFHHKITAENFNDLYGSSGATSVPLDNKIGRGSIRKNLLYYIDLNYKISKSILL